MLHCWNSQLIGGSPVVLLPLVSGEIVGSVTSPLLEESTGAVVGSIVASEVDPSLWASPRLSWHPKQARATSEAATGWVKRMR